jgi:hypothetical protein
LLHLIASAPKQNPKLVQFLELVLQTFQGAEQSGAVSDLPAEIKDAAWKCMSIFRGLMALLSPKAAWPKLYLIILILCPRLSGLWPLGP